MSEHRRAVIGSRNNFWLYSSRDGFDLTHPATPESAPVHPRVSLDTTRDRVTLDPAKTALVVVDMQNFFLSPCLGRSKDGKGIKACDQLLKLAIPACRKVGIRIIWLNWGLTQQDIDEMPPAVLRSFGFSTFPATTAPATDPATDPATANGHSNFSSQPVTAQDPQIYKGLGSSLGLVELEDGSKVQGGRMLMRDQWNTALYPPLEAARQEGLAGKCAREDALIHKNRMSGLWGSETCCTRYLDSIGIRSLLFAGVNTDQCVDGSLKDAFAKGYDCLLLSDGCATTSPDHGQQSVEFNTTKCWGFTLRCEDLARGVVQTVQ